eukprot:Selendium_serpulae@DN6467_c2_g1_i2.p1
MNDNRTIPSKLRGRLQAAASVVYNRLCAALLSPLIHRQYRRDFAKRNQLNPSLRQSLLLWTLVIEVLPPRPLFTQPRSDRLIIYTDGAVEPNLCRVGGLILLNDELPRSFSLPVPAQVSDSWLPRKNQICLVELWAVVIAIYYISSKLSHSSTFVFVDNDPARQCLVKGSSPRVDMGEYAAVITAILIETNARIWFDRVCSDANPVDGLSRNHRLTMEAIDVSSQIATSLPTAMERIETWLSKMKTLRVSLSANQGSHDSPFVIQDLSD